MDAIVRRVFRFLHAVALVMAFAFVPPAGAQTPYAVELLSQGFDAIGDQLSINDAGTVAFSSEGVFLVSDPGESVQSVPQGGSSTTELQLNDTGELLVRIPDGSARRLQLINLQGGVPETLEIGGFPFCSGGPNAGASCLGTSSCTTGEGFCQILTHTCIGGPRDGDVCTDSLDCKEPTFCYRPSLQDVGHSPSINNLGQVVHVGSDGRSVLLLLPNLQRVSVPGFDYREIRPQIADTGLVVVREGGLPTSPLVLFDFAGGLTQYATRIVVAENWTAIGRAPGVTRDGGLVAWAGDRGNGPGVFVAQPSLPTQIWPVAGDGNDDFANIVIDQQVAIENVRLPDGSSETRVVFVGERDGDVGAYSVSVTLRTPGPDLGLPSPILRVGDFVDSQKVLALWLSDKMNSRGDVAFRVITENAREGIARAKPARSQIVFREKADANSFWGVVGGSVPFTWDHVGFYYAPEDLVYESHPGYNGDLGGPDQLNPPVFDNCFWDMDYPPGPPKRPDIVLGASVPGNPLPFGICPDGPRFLVPNTAGLQAVHNKNTFADLSATAEPHSVQFEAIDIETSCADCMRNWIRARAQGGFPPWTSGQPDCDEGSFVEQASCFAAALANPVILEDWELRQKGKDDAFSCVGLVESAAEACAPCNPTLEGFVPNVLETLPLESVTLPTLTPGKMLAALRARSKGLDIRSHLEFFLDPVDFVLTDPDGLQLGYTPSLGEINDIPNSFYSGDASVEEVVIFNPKPGTWTLDIFGLGEEALVAAGGSTGVSSVFLNETLAEGDRRTFQLAVPNTGGGGNPEGPCKDIPTSLPNPAPQGPVSFRTVAFKGQEVPCKGDGRTFTALFAPIINESGEIAFAARDSGGAESIWEISPDSTLSRILEQYVVPNTNYRLLSFARYALNDSGALGLSTYFTVFTATKAILLDTDGLLTLEVRDMQPAPGTSSQFWLREPQIFRTFLTNAEFLFQAPVLPSSVPGAVVADGIWSASQDSSGLDSFAGSGSPAPGLPEAEFRYFRNIVVSRGGAIAFGADLAASDDGVALPNASGVWAKSVGGELQLRLREGQVVPGFTERRFLRPTSGARGQEAAVADSAELAVLAQLRDFETSQTLSSVVHVSASGDVGVLAQYGDCAPGSDQPFLDFQNLASNAHGDLVFGDSSGRVWFIPRGGNENAMGLVLRTGDQAPGSPGFTVRPQDSFINDNGDLLVAGILVGEVAAETRSAIILYPRNGDPVVVAAEGGVLDFGGGDRRTIKSVSLSWNSSLRSQEMNVFNVAREIPLSMSFENGSIGLFVAKVEVRGTGDRTLRQAKLCNGACDVNEDGSIDRRDVDLIFAARGTAAAGESDLRDADGDGLITAGDGRACSLECSQPECALPAGVSAVETNSACGLLGTEVLGLLGVAGWLTRRSQLRRGSM